MQLFVESADGRLMSGFCCTLCRFLILILHSHEQKIKKKDHIALGMICSITCSDKPCVSCVSCLSAYGGVQWHN